MLVSWWKFYIAPYVLANYTIEQIEDIIGMKLPLLPDNMERPPLSSDERWSSARKIGL
jgi:hypothetical protein